MRKAQPITLTSEARAQLQAWTRGHTAAQRLVLRAKIILAAAEGKQNQVIAESMSTTRATVAKWRKRYLKNGMDSISADAPRSGRKPKLTAEQAKDIVRKTTQELPDNATHWSTRTLAKALGTSRMRVCRVWQANQIKPHLAKSFKVSNDPHFEEKVVDIAGLHLDPRKHALVFSVDEKSQIQALDRTQKGLPLMPKHCATHTHDYVRHGTTTLFRGKNATSGGITHEVNFYDLKSALIATLTESGREGQRAASFSAVARASSGEASGFWGWGDWVEDPNKKPHFKPF